MGDICSTHQPANQQSDPYKEYPEERELHTLYTMKEEIGRGGFGVVYAAKRKSDGVEVAIK